MKNLKHIIKEEMDDFDFVRDVTIHILTEDTYGDGLRVKINEDHEYYRNKDDIPIYMEQSDGGYGTTIGKGEKMADDIWVNVKWDNGRRNNYPIGTDNYSLIMDL